MAHILSLVTYSFQVMWNNSLASGHLTQLQDHSMQLGQLEQAYKLTVHISAKTPKHFFVLFCFKTGS